AVCVDGVAAGSYPHAELGDDLAVDRHPAGGDEPLTGTSGPDAGRGQQLLEPDALGVVDVDRGSVLLTRQPGRLARLGRAGEPRAAALRRTGSLGAAVSAPAGARTRPGALPRARSGLASAGRRHPRPR